MVTETDVIVLTVAVVADVATNNYVIPSLEQEPCAMLDNITISGIVIESC